MEDCPLIGIFARNCIVAKIEKERAEIFLKEFHRLGYTDCRYHYGLFIENKGKTCYEKGRMVAAAGFSKARHWNKQGKDIRSYEWVRYASLPNTRVIGGMGKILQAFIKDVNPDDIMSYSDTSGDVYKKLGFTEEGNKVFNSGNVSKKFRLKLTEYE